MHPVGSIQHISAFCHIQLLHNAYDKYKKYKRRKPYQYGKVHKQANKNGHGQNGSVQADNMGCGCLASARTSRCARSCIGIVDAPGCDILILEFNERSLDKLLAILEQF